MSIPNETERTWCWECRACMVWCDLALRMPYAEPTVCALGNEYCEDWNRVEAEAEEPGDD